MASQQTLPRQTPPSQDTWPFVYATRPSAAPPGVLAATGQTSGKWLHLFMVGHVSFRHFIRCLSFSHWRSWLGSGLESSWNRMLLTGPLPGPEEGKDKVNSVNSIK